MYIIYRIFYFLFWLILISIVLFIFFIRRNKKTHIHPSQDKEWYLQFALSKEDFISQSFLLLSFLFFGITLLAFNRDLGEPLSWRSIFLITSFLGLIIAYYLKTIYTLGFSLFGLMIWWSAKASQLIFEKNIKMSVFLVGLIFMALLFYLIGRLHERQIKFKRFGIVYLIFGIIVVTLALFLFSTKPGIGIMGEIIRGESVFNSWQLILSLLILFVSLIGIVFYSAVQKLISPFELFAVLFLTFLFGIMVLLPEQNMFVQTSRSYSLYSGFELSGTGVFWALIYNFAIFFELLGLIFLGYMRREKWLINFGALFLFLLIILKYFDWFFTFLNKSIFFIGAGILLFVVGWLMEKGRRYMISNIKSQSQQVQQ
jgi:hypothetical protein